MAGKGKELRAKVKELTEALEKEQSANKLNTAEFQVQSCILEAPCRSGMTPTWVPMQASSMLSCISCLAGLIYEQQKPGRHSFSASF